MIARSITTIAALLQLSLAQSPDGLRILKTPDGLRYGMLAAAGARTAGPRPTVFVYAARLEDSLGSEAYNKTCNLLRQDGFLCVSLDLAAHGEDHRPGEPADLKGWRRRTDLGEPWLTEFTARASSVLDSLIANGSTDAARVAAYGISRGGFSALQWAARDRRVRAVAAFSPVTHLQALDEFADISPEAGAAKLDLETVAPALADRPVWIAIGNNDRRVGTRYAIEFTLGVLRAAADRKLTPQIELHVVTGEASPRGHHVHAAAPAEAAAWILRQFGQQEAPR